MNNPLKFVDPSGELFSPYFDTNGTSLGVDEKGFKGQIYITTREAFDASAKNGIADSKLLQANKATINFSNFYNVIRRPISDNAINKVLNKVAENTALPDGSTLKKGTFNIYQAEIVAQKGIMANAYYDGMKDGKHQVLWEVSDYEWTVENTRGTMIHEVWGHGVKKHSTGKTHHLAYLLQIKYGWEGTTERYRKHISNQYYDLVPVVNGYKEIYRSDYDKIKNYINKK